MMNLRTYRKRTLSLMPLLILGLYTNALPQSQIQDILDAVSIDSLYRTVEELCGVRPVVLPSGIDTIWTRSNYSPYIHVAEEYMSTKLEKWGYAVERQPFHMPKSFLDIEFCDEVPDIGWLLSESAIYRTTDGGQGWERLYESPEPMSAGTKHPESIFIIDSSSVIVTVHSFDPAYFLRSVNAGLTWERRTLPELLRGIYFADDSVGWICGSNGLISKTEDTGHAWIEVGSPTTEALSDILFLDDLNGWIVGRNGTMLRTADGGETWQVKSSSTTSHLTDIQFIDDDTGFVCGWDGTFLKTTDGGESWIRKPVPPEILPYLKQVDFLDASRGIVVSMCEDFLTTSDGGETWTSYDEAFPLTMLDGVDLIDENTVWLCGSNLISRSADFGATWTNTIDNIVDFDNCNLIVELQGTDFPDDDFIICAHYDTYAKDEELPAPGADDNASGTAAVLEAARVLRDYAFPYTLKFILFAGEEIGPMTGSKAYAENALEEGEKIVGVINLDMIGYDSNDDGSVGIITGLDEECKAIGRFLASNIDEWSLPLKPILRIDNYHAAGDHASFWNAGFPAVDIEEDFLNGDTTPFYHEPGDLPTTLNKEYHHAVSKLAIGTLASMAEGGLTTVIHTASSIPAEFKLHDPYPNPFNPIVHLEYTLTKPGHVSIDIIDQTGRSIDRILDERQPIGSHRIGWNGENFEGCPAPSGMYMFRLNYEGCTRHRKIILVR